jgi:hypothetical protein
MQDPPKFTQIGIFGLKTNHLATLTQTPVFSSMSLPLGMEFVIRGELGPRGEL